MAKLNLIKKGTTNAIQTTLNGSLSSSATSITLNSVTGLQNTTGLGVIDRVDSSGTLTPTKREYVYWTSISGSALTLPNTSDGRGAAGSTAQSHADGAIFEEILGVDEWNGLITSYSAQHNDNGTHSALTTTSLIAASVASIALPNNSVPATALSTSAILLGYAQVTANQGSITTLTDLTSLSVAVTVPVGGRSVKITGYGNFNANAAGPAILWINEGATHLNVAEVYIPDNTRSKSAVNMVVLTPSAGSHTYKLQADSTVTLNLNAVATQPAFILVELI